MTTITVTTSATLYDVDVDVEVDLSELDTDDLLEELRSRRNHNSATDDIQRMYDAFAINDTAAALMIARQFVMSETGRIL